MLMFYVDDHDQCLHGVGWMDLSGKHGLILNLPWRERFNWDHQQKTQRNMTNP